MSAPGAAIRLTARGLSKIFPSRDGERAALAGIDLTLAGGEFVTLVGPSGCGKTTLLRILAGLLVPSAGEVRIEGGESAAGPATALVFQEHGLFPWLTAAENVAFPLEALGVAREERRATARRLLDEVGLAAFAGSYPGQLSTGMRQRVAIARAFASPAPILLLDEPLGALDPSTRFVLQEQLLEVWQRHRKTVLLVTHDIEEALRLGDRLLVLSGRPGRLLEEIPLRQPRPRGADAASRAALEALRWEIWQRLEGDVRRAAERS